MKINLEKIRKYLQPGDDLIVVTHFSPDGDAVGSLLAFSGMLDQLGIDHVLVVDDEVPEKYSFLPGIERILSFGNWSGEKVFERVVMLDAGALPRIGKIKSCIGPDTRILNIDHHYTGPYMGDINLVDVEACATAEILYDLCDLLDVEITPQIAYGLYVGILTDTGRFRFSNTSERALTICGDLITKGVNPGLVTENIYYNLQFKNVQALSRALSTIKLYYDGLVCMSSLGRKHSTDDTEGFIEYASSVKGVVLAAFIRELDDRLYKVSLRSRCKVDVSEVARKFGGGGHLKAAGFRYTGRKKNLVANLLDELGCQIKAHKLTRERSCIEPLDEDYESSHHRMIEGDE